MNKNNDNKYIVLTLKEFLLDRVKPVLKPLILPDNLLVRDALERVLRLPSVASKRYLTNKVNASLPSVASKRYLTNKVNASLPSVASKHYLTNKVNASLQYSICSQ